MGQGVHGAWYIRALSNGWKVCQGEFGELNCPSVEVKGHQPQMGESSVAQRDTGTPTYRELMRFSAFREWVSQRSVRASSSL